MRSTREGILASIFHRFWSILGGKLARKIDQKSSQKPSDNDENSTKNEPQINLLQSQERPRSEKKEREK